MWAGSWATASRCAALRSSRRPTMVWSNVCTFSARSPSALDLAAHTILARIPSRSHALLTLSKNIPPSSQLFLLSHLKSRHIKVFGCLVDPLRSPDLYTLSCASFSPSKAQYAELLPTDANSVPPPSLGREIWSTSHSRNDASEEQLMQHLNTVDKSQWFSQLQTASSSKVRDSHTLSNGIFCKTRFLFSISRRYPESLIRELHELCPNAHKLGLIAASTVFERNGESSVLFNEHGIQSVDSLTLAIYDQKDSFSQPSVSILGLNPLGEALRVTSARGNIISSLSSPIKNATMTLKQLVDMDKSKGDKNVKYFLGVKRKDASTTTQIEALHPDECDYIARIMSGSTSRGTVAISSTDNVRDGDLVQFYRQDREIEYDPTNKNADKLSLRLVTTPADGNLALRCHNSPNMHENGVEMIENVFYGASGYGSFLGRSGHMAMTYADEGSICEIKLGDDT